MSQLDPRISGQIMRDSLIHNYTSESLLVEALPNKLCKEYLKLVFATTKLDDK